MLKTKKEYVVSRSTITRPSYRQLFGSEAENALKRLGFSFIHVGNDGYISALDNRASTTQGGSQVLNGYRVYEHDVPDI